MKLAFLFAGLFASVDAIRLHSKSKALQDEESLADEKAQEYVKWLEAELKSEDALTWGQLKGKVTEMAGKHGATVNDDNWKLIKTWFDEVDNSGDGIITFNELEAEMFADHGH